MTKKLFTNNNILFNQVRNNKFGNKTLWIYISIYIFITYFVIDSIPYFIDYHSYNDNINANLAWLKYKYEPVSATLLDLNYKLDWGAKGLYTMLWLIGISSLIIIHKKLERRDTVFYIFLILNPSAIILFEFARQYLAYLFFLMSFFFLKHFIKSKLLVTLSFLSHTASLGFSLAFYSLLKLKLKYFIFMFIFMFAVFFFLSDLFFPHYTVYIEEKGRGRAIIILATSLFFSIITIKRKKQLLSIIIMTFFFFYTYEVSPQAGRFAPYFVFFITSHGIYTVKKTQTLFMIHIFLLLNIFVSFIIVIGGLYGYG